MFYKWSCRYFSKPLLTGEESINARRQEREKLALDYIVKCQNSSVSKLQNRITSWDTKFENGTKAALMQPFSPVVIASDENERIRVWNYEEASLLNSFSNHDHPDKGVSKLCVMNEFDEELLLVASRDGNIRIWKDYASLGQQKLVTAFPSIQGLTPGVRSVNAVVDWQPHSGYLFSSGGISPIMAWDLNKEQLVSTIPLPNESSIISSLAVSQAQESEVAAGFADGYVRLYDIRIPKMLVKQTRAHTQHYNRVVGIGFQPGSGPTKIVSASRAGNIQFLDMRRIRSSYLIIDALRGSLTSLAVHRHAPIIACGSAKKLIKVFNLEGDALGTIHYYPTFIAQKTRSVSCLAFHPYRVLLAAGADDARVSIYADEISQPW